MLIYETDKGFYALHITSKAWKEWNVSLSPDCSPFQGFRDLIYIQRFFNSQKSAKIIGNGKEISIDIAQNETMVAFLELFEQENFVLRHPIF